MNNEKYSFHEYLLKFTNSCLKCEGSGVRGKYAFAINKLRPCEDCNGTGRRDKKTDAQIIEEGLEKMPRAEFEKQFTDLIMRRILYEV